MGSPPKDITVGCLFAAIGGFAHAFRQVDARVLWANEEDRYAVQTFERNLPGVRVITKDVRQLHVHADALQPVDVLTAGFPCQPFSVAGEKRGLADQRGTLFQEILRLISEFGERKPKVLMLENVKHLRKHEGGQTFRTIQSQIQKAGYWFQDSNAMILNTLDYSAIPQNRERIFMVALRADYFLSSKFAFPKKESSPRSHVSAFLDLDRPASPSLYFTPANRYHRLFVDAIDDPSAIYQLRRSYVRKNLTGTCFTLMASMGDGGHNQPVIKDAWGIRKLTPMECARLQGYDDSWFSFPPELSLSQQYKQVGNSVTVPVVRKIASTIVELLRAEAMRKDVA